MHVLVSSWCLCSDRCCSFMKRRVQKGNEFNSRFFVSTLCYNRNQYAPSFSGSLPCCFRLQFSIQMVLMVNLQFELLFLSFFAIVSFLLINY
ncbi:Uncharacterized protein TCM_030176 [Theobroma cacao]|uniref:Uncharacterized protein n=1 Tax=Theobroma cacao TaxID=3641 RepID=A0A061GHJ9_THECC|nr:Uncharacterized protein TCM_030176 [Theobroma cacao]